MTQATFWNSHARALLQSLCNTPTLAPFRKLTAFSWLLHKPIRQSDPRAFAYLLIAILAERVEEDQRWHHMSAVHTSLQQLQRQKQP